VSPLKRVILLLTTAIALLAAGGAAQGRPAHAGDRIEVVVTLGAAPLHGRSLASAAGTRVAQAQESFLARLRATIPGTTVRWRYRTVLDGFALVVPRRDIPRVRALPGVEMLYASVRYRSKLNTSPQAIGAPDLWGPTLATAGDGVKIAIIDDGVDQDHPFLSPAGYAMPAGFPKGQTQFTTAKVIVARSFTPASPTSKYGGAPFDPDNSFHATHVAGIAAGNHGTRATLNAASVTVSGVAPHAYIGNYKALTVPTPGFGLDGNSPEIAAAIEAAVNDGMDVINLSLGEPEVEPTRDLVVQALQGAAAAGVVPVVAAGNDFEDFGRGSVGSPGNTPDAITVAASTKGGVLASFSSSGPTPVSVQMKPDLTAPGADILSSVPPSQGTWAVFQGTSMASPHIAGAAALLKERHPTWTVAQIKSALVQTAVPAYSDAARRVEAPTTREGGGFVNLLRADNPLLFAAPTGLSFGLVKPGAPPLSRTVTLTDAGGGVLPWTVSLVEQQTHDPAVEVSVPPTATVPSAIAMTVTVGAGAVQNEHTGFVVLTRGTDVRRIPFWFFVETPRLAAPSGRLLRPGTYKGDTARGSARVAAYRYPDNPGGAGLATNLPGPEQVFRVQLAKPAANFGVVVTKGAVDPRVVFAGDENRLVGYPGLPLNINPYGESYGKHQQVAGAVLPAAGAYDVVFDEAGTGKPFTFRYWLDDTRPPTVKLLTRTVARGGKLLLAATDAGAGIDPTTIRATVDGAAVKARLAGSRITVPVTAAKTGRHKLALTVSDYQESKNMEDVARILPNTRTVTTSFAVH
jgi:subtilisin family serine protease